MMILILLFLTGCILPKKNEYAQFEHLAVEVSNDCYFVRLGPCKMTDRFNVKGVPLYDGKRITFRKDQFDLPLRAILLNRLEVTAAMSDIKLVRIGDSNVVVSFAVEEVYYDLRTKEAVIKLTVRINNEWKNLTLRKKIELRDFTKIFDSASEEIIKLLKIELKKFNKAG